MKDWLFTSEGKAYLQSEYVDKARSTYDIAAERGTYANKVRRALVAHGYRLRDKSKAQAAALASGRHAHPTKGRTRSDEERDNIRAGLKRHDPTTTTGDTARDGE